MKTLARIALIAWSVWTTPAAAIDGRDDYPYVRAWALTAGWNKRQLEDELRLARVNKIPQTAVYQDRGTFYGWALLRDLNPAFQESLVSFAAKKPRPFFGLPEP